MSVTGPATETFPPVEPPLDENWFAKYLSMYKEMIEIRCTTQGRVFLTYHRIPNLQKSTNETFGYLVDQEIPMTVLANLAAVPSSVILIPGLEPHAKPFDQRGRLWTTAAAIAMPPQILYATADSARRIGVHADASAWMYHLRIMVRVDDPGAVARLAKKKPEIDDDKQSILFDELATTRQKTTYVRKPRKRSAE